MKLAQHHLQTFQFAKLLASIKVTKRFFEVHLVEKHVFYIEVKAKHDQEIKIIKVFEYVKNFPRIVRLFLFLSVYFKDTYQTGLHFTDINLVNERASAVKLGVQLRPVFTKI